MSKDARSRWPRTALLTVPATLGIGFLTGRLANSGYGNPWFDALVKPTALPPGWVFPLAWSVLYVMLGIVLAMALAAPRGLDRTRALALFGAQMLLNFAWTPVFFLLHRPVPALAIILAMLALAIAATFALARLDRRAAWLMVPYLAWLSFASILNAQVIALNP